MGFAAQLDEALRVPSPADVQKRYFGKEGPEDLAAAYERMVTGMALLVAQGVIATNPYFGERQIDQYVKIRREFHPQFSAACSIVANNLDELRQLRPVSTLLRRVARTTPQQAQQAIGLSKAAVRGFKGSITRPEDQRLRRAIFALRNVVSMTDEPEDQPEYYRIGDDFQELFGILVKFDSTPPKLRTLFRKLMKLGTGALTTFADVANPGAWTIFSKDEKEKIRQQAQDIEVKQKAALDIEDPQKRSTEYRRLAREMAALQQKAGVNLGIITGADEEPVDVVLRKEAKQQANGVVSYIVEKFIESLKEQGEWEKERTFAGREKLTKRELGKLITKLRKVATLDTAQRIVDDAVQRRILSKDFSEAFAARASAATKNLAIENGIPLTPLDFTPMSVEQFQAKHDTGDVRFDKGYTEEQRQEVLGRVSRALSDLETVYGKGFAGLHARGLEFQFIGGEGVGGSAKASYFGWDDPQRWQPRVKFGKDFDNLLAHELSHYLEDLLAFRIEKASGEKMPRYGDVAHGHGDIFGATGVDFDHSVETLKTSEGAFVKRIREEVPELVEFAEAVQATPDYQRWRNMMPAAYDIVVDRAIQDVTGETDYSKIREIADVGLKSKLPPGVVDKADKLYREMMRGDDRGLRYFYSAPEVWARMCEQYVYTKLCKGGIVNPWLTHMSYDAEATYDGKKFIETKTFEEKIYPIFERLFARLRKKGMLSEDVRRLLEVLGRFGL